MIRFQPRTLVLCGGLSLAVLIAYANHFQNEFHFDDFHTVSNNPFIRELRFIPRFFTDPLLFSTLPDHATWRPLVSTSLAIDYHFARPIPGVRRLISLVPFHVSTFLWFLVQLILMFFLFRRLMDEADPHPSNIWTALLATACYGLHPACAETVNYIIQRGDLYSTLGLVASLLVFIAYPAQRKYGWYLLPAIAAYLSKAPALIYPFILLAYVWLFESQRESQPGKNASPQGLRNLLVRATMPVFLVTALGAILTAKMTPAAYNPGAASGFLYRVTQPWIALHYFKVFFLPTDLTADTDWGYDLPFSVQALAGDLFVIALLAAAFYATRRRETRPIAFGIFWFFLALLPTSLMPLAEVTNDHRMFFPFVGLALAVFWTLRLVLFQETARLTRNPAWVRGAIAVLAVVFVAEIAGTHQRNNVWRTEASLWHDVTIKSPKNGRGMMNYAITFIPADYPTALNYLTIADRLLPDYYYTQINLGIAYGGLNRDREAEEHYQRAIQLSPNTAEPHIYFGQWLSGRLRVQEARRELEIAVRTNPLAINARHTLIQTYYQTNDRAALDNMIRSTLQVDPRDPVALRFRNLPSGAGPQLADATLDGWGGLPPNLLALVAGKTQSPPFAPLASTTASRRMGPEGLVNISAAFIKSKQYEEAMAAAKQATEMNPSFAPAYNNLAAAYMAMGRWDEAIVAAQQAVLLDSKFQDAKDNLAYSIAAKRKLEAEIRQQQQ